MNEAQQVLRKVFGYESFRAPQQEIIEAVLSNRDCFVLMPTGAGKSICYQIPALIRPGIAIIVSPLISLMKDQVDALRLNGVAAECYNSSLSQTEARRVLKGLDEGNVDLLYVAPERLMMTEFQDRLRHLPIALFAIDEAHCVSQWGHDFRPEYVQLGRLRPLFKEVPFIALTATADKQTREDVLLRLNLQDPAVFVSGFDRPNIRYTVVEKAQPLSQLEVFLRERPDEPGIVYCLSRKRVDAVADHLRRRGISAQAYHAGYGADERTRVQDAFQRDDVQVVVATVAFGMGIDKPNVRFVVHYDLPKNMEGYYQETGRAGRDGLPAEALLLFGAGDIMTARRLIEASDNPTQKAIELKKLTAMVEYAEAQTCRRRIILRYFGEHTTKPCMNCDICLVAPDSYDATDDVKKALMAVYELKQRFGLGYVVDMLRGSKSARIMESYHDSLSSYGSGKHLSGDEWASIIRQLIQRGLLIQDAENYGILKLTPETKPVLRDGVQVFLAKPRVKVETPKTKKGKKSKAKGDLSDRDDALFQELRALRRQIADREKVPAYVVFSDETLRQMAILKPRTRAELLKVSGVGEKKADRYGSEFLLGIQQS
ncbi:MAG: DNA helicase RecQ [Fimbriimonas sp.]|nr:DNA helicase RecQ [Fimbriimonas sp.]